MITASAPDWRISGTLSESRTTTTRWAPRFADASFGVLPLITATLWTSAIALLVAVPLGLASAIYLAEYAPRRLRAFLKPILEVLAGVPTVIFAGEEYGTGSSRDWAAKGTRLLGVRAVVARSFERIHRANLVGMGVLPLQFLGGDNVQSLGISGDERFELEGLDGTPVPQQEVRLVVTTGDGRQRRIPLRLRIDTPIEVAYYLNDGILPFVLRQLLAAG